jgi:hypothetical protein
MNNVLMLLSILLVFFVSVTNVAATNSTLHLGSGSLTYDSLSGTFSMDNALLVAGRDVKAEVDTLNTLINTFNTTINTLNTTINTLNTKIKTLEAEATLNRRCATGDTGPCVVNTAGSRTHVYETVCDDSSNWRGEWVHVSGSDKMRYDDGCSRAVCGEDGEAKIVYEASGVACGENGYCSSGTCYETPTNELYGLPIQPLLYDGEIEKFRLHYKSGSPEFDADGVLVQWRTTSGSSSRSGYVQDDIYLKDSRTTDFIQCKKQCGCDMSPIHDGVIEAARNSKEFVKGGESGYTYVPFPKIAPTSFGDYDYNDDTRCNTTEKIACALGCTCGENSLFQRNQGNDDLTFSCETFCGNADDLYILASNTYASFAVGKAELYSHKPATSSRSSLSYLTYIRKLRVRYALQGYPMSSVRIVNDKVTTSQEMDACLQGCHSRGRCY